MDERETTAVIDRTLAGEPVETGYPLEQELQDLTLALAAEAPEPDAGFAERLDERVATGFPRERRGGRARARARRAVARLGLAAPGGASDARLPAPRRSGPLAALRTRSGHLIGAAASLAIALAVAVSLVGGDRDGTTEHADIPAAERPAVGSPSGGSVAGRRPGAVGPGASSEAASDIGGPSQGAATRDSLLRARRLPGSRARAPGFAPGADDRRIERSASLTLAAPAGRLDGVADNVATVTERHRGFVLRSSLATGRGGATTGGEFELRIPAGRLQPTLADLAALGQIRARTQSGEDVTASFVGVGDRLEAARAERRSLLARLESADSDSEAESLRLQLDANAREINRLQGRLRAMRVRTNYANVSVTLKARDGDGSAAPPGDGLGGALDDALATLGESLELAIRALGVLIPLGLLALAAALAARAFQRRRREAALS